MFIPPSIDTLVRDVLVTAGESEDRFYGRTPPNFTALERLEDLLEISLRREEGASLELVGEDIVPYKGTPVANTANIEDEFEVTMFDELVPYYNGNAKRQCAFYLAVSRLMCEAYQAGLVLQHQTSPQEVTSLFDFSLNRNNAAVRCTRILNALIDLGEASFCLEKFIKVVSRKTKNMVQELDFFRCYTHYLKNLPKLESEVMFRQNASRDVHLRSVGASLSPAYSSNVARQSSEQSTNSLILTRMQESEKFSARIESEFTTHVELVTNKFFSLFYRYSPSVTRGVMRAELGSIFHNFTLQASINNPSDSSGRGSRTGAITMVGGGGIPLGNLSNLKNTSACGISGLLSATYNIVSGFNAESDVVVQEKLLMDILIPMHKPQGMVLWRDQTPLLELYHEALVKCVSKILDNLRNIHSSDLSLSRVIKSLLHPDVWPEGRVSNTPKRVLLLHEIDTLIKHHILNRSSSSHEQRRKSFESFAQTLILRLCECIEGDNSRTSERALQFFKEEEFVETLFASSSAETLSRMRYLLKALCHAESTAMEPSWNPTVNKMTASVLRKLQETNRLLFRQVANELFSDNQVSQPNDSVTKNTKNAVISPVNQKLFSKVSLKASMDGWKPPSKSSSNMLTRRRLYRTEDASSETLTSSMKSQSFIRDHVSPLANTQPSTVFKDPPLTITGVAPWAMNDFTKKSHPRTTESSSITVCEISLPNNRLGIKRQAAAKPDDLLGNITLDLDHVDSGQENDKGIQLVQTYIEKLCPFELETQDGIKQHSSWSKTQLSESPTLLPDMKFHDLVFGHDLGSGAFSTVRYARQIIKDKTRSQWPEYAVKVISTSKIQELGYESSVNREIAILRLLSHPGIARLISSFRFHDGAYLVLEYASGGDLYEYLRKNGSLDHESTQFVVGEVVAALRSIHDAGFVYSDLKPENILITESGHIKVTDFGACRPYTYEAKQLIKIIGTNVVRDLKDGDWRESKKEKDSATRIVSEVYDEPENDRIEGTAAYLPPEVVAGSFPSPSADSWALGCVLYQCISGKAPLLKETDEATKHRIVSFDLESEDDLTFFGCIESKKDSHFKPEAKKLIRSLLRRIASYRPTMLDVANHDYFEGVDVFSLYKYKAPDLIQGSVAPISDSKWSRRQFSSIWAPQPKAYDLGRSSPIETGRKRGPVLQEFTIQEGDERSASFLPKHLSQNLLTLREKD